MHLLIKHYHFFYVKERYDLFLAINNLKTTYADFVHFSLTAVQANAV